MYWRERSQARNCVEAEPRLRSSWIVSWGAFIDFETAAGLKAVGRELRNTVVLPIRMRSLSGLIVALVLPAAMMMRPQFGSAP